MLVIIHQLISHLAKSISWKINHPEDEAHDGSCAVDQLRHSFSRILIAD
jgi:hypothetical protein